MHKAEFINLTYLYIITIIIDIICNGALSLLTYIPVAVISLLHEKYK